MEFFDEIWWRCSTHDEEHPHKISSKNSIVKRAKRANPYGRSVNSGPHEIFALYIYIRSSVTKVKN
ncbi:hypothetical protein LguiA_000960 [Lonicera macranthoides]